MKKIKNLFETVYDMNKSSDINRRGFLGLAGGLGASLIMPRLAWSDEKRTKAHGLTAVNTQPRMEKADFTINIAPVIVEVSEESAISTIGYNGAVPGPVLRMREGVPITVDLYNDTDVPELAHWHGQFVPPEIDGAEQEKSLFVPAHGHLRYSFTPGPAGARWLHTHVTPMSDLHRGTYMGQFAFVYIEPRDEAGRYDQEVFLATHEWEPFLTHEEDEEEGEGEQGEKGSMDDSMKSQPPHGWEVGYRLFSINGKALGYGESIRVREGQRVLFHILNASATENIRLSLPGHRFKVVALDGNPVPNPKEVTVLQLGVAERIDAVVEMNQPGVWILGTPKDEDRTRGMGIVVEYANKTGQPRWYAPADKDWDYTAFGVNKPTPKPDQVIPMVIQKINAGMGGFNLWTINGETYKELGPPMVLHKGLRYRLSFDNQTDDAHPLHLHRNSFELTNVHGKPTSGVLKDVVLIKPFSKIEVDFTADHPGLTLFHCHQQLHMDFGFMKLFNVV